MATTAGPQTQQLSCKKFTDSSSGKDYFVQVVYTPSPHGEVEESSLDLVVTDGSQAWTAEGLNSTGLQPLSLPNRVRHAVEAFSDLLPASQTYTYELNFEVEEPPELWAKWVGLHGKAMKFTVRAPLRPAADSGALISGLLDSLLSNLASLRATSATLEQQCREWRGAAESSQALVEEYVDRQQQHEREMSEKVAALLNAKKKKLRELRAELDRLKREGVQAAADAGNEGYGMEIEGEGEEEEEEGGKGEEPVLLEQAFVPAEVGDDSDGQGSPPHDD